MGNIVLLDELTINKIAAGEVIERPASVVKEILENSIDAGATNVNIDIQNGGISKIRITDNGKGIQPDDMRIAFERHATSKIRQADDLETIKTMGFRGEALASIAAIAKVEMVSRTADSEIGNRIVVEGGEILNEEPIGCSIGTTITVENLFYNTPVRYKFLKKDYTETGYIEDVVTRIALVNTNVAIKLVNSGKTILQTNGNGDRQSVIYSVYGKDIAQGIVNVDYQYEDMKVTGVVGKPEIARSNKTNQLFFINNRYVKDKTLSAATEQAFRGMLPVGKFGFVILNLEMDPRKVDVNVHPAKLEVRFADEGAVFKAIMYAIKEALLKGDIIQNVTKEEQASEEMPIEVPPVQVPSVQPEKHVTTINEGVEASKKIVDMFKSISKEEEEREEEEVRSNLIEELYNQRKAKQENKIDYTQIIPKINIDKEDDVEQEKHTPASEQQKPLKVEEGMNQDFETMYEKTFGDIPASMKPKEEKFQEMKYVDNMSVFTKNDKYTNYKYIGTAFRTYLIMEIENELYIIDQHAAHERIMYEKIKKNFYSDDKDAQLMLLPDVITLTHKEMSIARENMKTFEKAGFVLEEFGDNTIKLSGVPNVCMELDTKSLFLDILDEIDTVARTERQEIEEKFIATVACKSAVKANMNLSEAEVDALMEKLLALPNPFTCPHGRPTAIKMTKYDIEKKFSRK